MRATYGDRVFVADLSPDRAGPREPKMMRIGGVRPHTTQGWLKTDAGVACLYLSYIYCIIFRHEILAERSKTVRVTRKYGCLVGDSHERRVSREIGGVFANYPRGLLQPRPAGSARNQRNCGSGLFVRSRNAAARAKERRASGRKAQANCQTCGTTGQTLRMASTPRV
jgi:hypothetical protein